MNSILFILIFVGIILIVDGYYRDRIEFLKKHTKTIYKFIPRNQYEDSLGYMKFDMFESKPDTRSAGRPDDIA
jgi:hypothetical protein